MSTPGSLNELLIGAAGAAGGGYQISRSLRFNSADSAYLNRTPASAGNRKTWTWAGWVKKNQSTNSEAVFSVNNYATGIYINDTNGTNPGQIAIDFSTGTTSGTRTLRYTSAVFRDFSSWYHIVVAVDTTQAVDSNRIKLYVNGVQQALDNAAVGTWPVLNAEGHINSTVQHVIGYRVFTTDYRFNGYLADIHFIDGQALDPTSFTEVDATTGQLVPIAYSGTYGTNGFHLPFSDNSTAAALGTDTSGNGNTWTVNNISITETSPAIFNAALNATPFTDSSASSVSITNNGSIATTTAGTNSFNISNAASFSGGSASGLTTGSAFNRTGLYTLDVYFKCTLAQQSRFLTNDGTSTGQGLAIATDGSINCYDFGNAVLAPAGAVSANTWYHFRLIANGSTVLASYLNGSAQTISGSFSNFAANTALRIGWGETGVSHSFDGLLGPIRITAANLGKPPSGGLSTTSGTISNNPYAINVAAGNDSLVDTPTNYGDDTGAGEVRGNYATLNPLDKASIISVSNGNLDFSSSDTANRGLVTGTLGVSSGKWYYEVTIGTERVSLGFVKQPASLNETVGYDSTGYGYNWTGAKINNNAGTAYGATFTTGDVIGIALDLDAGSIQFYKNGTGQGIAFSGLSGSFVPAVSDGSSGGGASGSANFGQRPFAYTAPSGFKALCTTNLPAPVVAKPSTVMDVKLYTGNGSTQTISGLGFSPDLVWIKSRSNTTWHNLTDVVRGSNKSLYSNSTIAETTETDIITSINSDGFTLGADANADGTNINGNTYVAWTWDAGSSTVTNTQGSITSSVRANASAGFSIVTLTYSSVAGTVGHGLGVAPQMIIVKRRNTTGNWYVAHTGLTNMSGYYLLLESTAAQGAASWGGAPTSTVFNMANSIFGSGDYVAYCFAPVDGYSSFGSYTGNGSTDGPFVFCNFRPRWLMLKRTDSGDNWAIIDTARSSYNVSKNTLWPNSSAAEATTYPGGAAVVPNIDFTANGFKLRAGPDGSNVNAATYIYAAFAESPFQYARAR